MDCSSRAGAVIDSFAAYVAVTHNAGQPPKLPFPLRDLDPGLLVPPELSSKQHFDQFIRFTGLAIVTNRQTDRHTNIQTALLPL